MVGALATLQTLPRAAIGMILLLIGCAPMDPLAGLANQCAGVGHAPGSPGFALCMSHATPAQAESSDERRERQRWEARLERERVVAERRVREEARSVIGMSR
jgi:hypothetical protein